MGKFCLPTFKMHEKLFTQPFYVRKFLSPNQFLFGTNPSLNNERSLSIPNERLTHLLLYGEKDFPNDLNKNILELTQEFIHDIGQFCGTRSLIKKRRMRQANLCVENVRRGPVCRKCDSRLFFSFFSLYVSWYKLPLIII